MYCVKKSLSFFILSPPILFYWVAPSSGIIAVEVSLWPKLDPSSRYTWSAAWFGSNYVHVTIIWLQLELQHQVEKEELRSCSRCALESSFAASGRIQCFLNRHLFCCHIQKVLSCNWKGRIRSTLGVMLKCQSAPWRTVQFCIQPFGWIYSSFRPLY